jgi:hypothetical protein
MPSRWRPCCGGRRLTDLPDAGSLPAMAKTEEAGTGSRAKSLGWWALALGTLAIGYADLARGGVTVAPVLLIVGYCILVPLAILK